VFVDRCLSFFVWPLCCLSFFVLWLQITLLVSSNLFSCNDYLHISRTRKTDGMMGTIFLSDIKCKPSTEMYCNICKYIMVICLGNLKINELYAEQTKNVYSVIIVNAKWAICKLYHGKNRLHFDLMMIMISETTGLG
jgi:hypothetical protein